MKENFFIINPASKGGRNKRFLSGFQSWIQLNFPQAVFKETQGVGHASKLAIEAGKEGFRNCFVIGGDGTLHEVVNGMASLQSKARPRLGFIAAGAAGDFARQIHEQYGNSNDYYWLKEPEEVKIDIGKAVLKRNDKPNLKKYFINIASIGLAGEVIRRVNFSHKRLGAWEYLRSTLLAGLKYKPSKVRIRGLNQGHLEVMEDLELLLLVVANSRYFGGGMCIAPDAKLDDGQFQFLISEKVPYLSLIAQIPILYRGNRLQHPKIHYNNGDKLSVESLKGALPLDLDGEFYQADSVEFEIIPKAVTLLVAKNRYHRS